jgi:sensor histidine kinase YesM
MFTKRYLRILSHIIFWVLILAFFTFIYGVRKGNYLELLEVMLGTLPVDMAYTYFVIYFLIPRFLLRRKYIHFIILFAVSITVVLIVEWTINYEIMYPWIYDDYDQWKNQITYFSTSALNMYITIGFLVLLASAIKLSKNWLESQQAKSNLEIQNRSSELALLRSQVNPHFLFNTLNNIDALIRKDPEQASDTVVKLSEIMRYFIYEANTDKMPLEKEVDYLHNFVELQRIRYSNPNHVRFQVSGSPSNLVIAPMMFIPFVENAFKHGIRQSKTPAIAINLWIHENGIRFEVMNYFQLNHSTDTGKGIGLANVRRRLELIYPEKHSLAIRAEENKYFVTLEIKLR